MSLSCMSVGKTSLEKIQISKAGALKTNALTFGAKVSTDQSVSSVSGCLLPAFGREKTHKQYCEGTILIEHLFCSVFRTNFHLMQQKRLDLYRGLNTIHNRIVIRGYRRDNEVCKSSPF